MASGFGRACGIGRGRVERVAHGPCTTVFGRVSSAVRAGAAAPFMKKILVIDDDPAVQSLTVKALQSRGFLTLTAQDGLVGVDMAKRHLPDLIICDIQMPNLDGYGALALLRKDPVTSAIPFIFLTGLSEKREIRHGMVLGADDYLTKPFTGAELVLAVNTRLDKHDAIHRQSDKRLDDLRENIGMALPHELLTPLNGIIGLSSLLMDENMVYEPHEIRDFSANMHRSAMRLHRLIENFLLYSELELVASDPRKVAALRQGEHIEVKERMSRIAHEVAVREDRVADLELEVADVHVVMSPLYFNKVVSELIENAFKFSKVGNPVHVLVRVEGGTLSIEIRDQGRGMTAEQIASIGAHMQFERRFYEQQGVGLGMIIAKRLAELYGGHFSIESIPGRQTRLELNLPLRSDPA